MSTQAHSPVRTERVVVLIGPAQAGKTTVATHLVNRYQHSRFRFADTLKEMLRVLGCTTEQIDGHDKEVPLDLLCGKTTRHAMQTLGTEWRDMLGKELWAIQTIAKIGQSSAMLVVVDDSRFPHELDLLRQSFDVTVIRVWNSKRRYPFVRMWLARRRWGRTLMKILPALYIHESEAWWPVLEADHEIDNHGTLSDLGIAINDAMQGRTRTASKTRIRAKEGTTYA